MDDAVTPTKTAPSIPPSLRYAAVLAAVLVSVALVSLPGAAAAQALQDPTRPAAGAAVSSAAVPAPAAGPQLQTILAARTPGGRHFAVIDGETVHVGERFRGARVTRIGETEVELRRGNERQVLRLYAQEPAGMTPLGRATAQR